MLDNATFATQDLASRVQLLKLRNISPPYHQPPRSSQFRVHGWRWHHIGILRDLTRLESKAQHKRHRLCDMQSHNAATQRVQFRNAIEYIIQDNWNLHDTVQEKVFLPWIRDKETDKFRHARANIVNNETKKIQKQCTSLTRTVSRWSIQPKDCYSELDSIIHSVQRLKRNGAALFQASEAVLVPRVNCLFSEREQLKFNRQVLKYITGKQARISLVIFADAVDATNPSVAKRSDRNNFQRDVPALIRKFGVPFWRNRFVADKIQFLTEE